MKTTALKAIKTARKQTIQKKVAKAPPTTEVTTKSQFDVRCPCEKPGHTLDAPRVVAVNASLDVGFGNQLFIRGEGSRLSWEKGVPLTSIKEATWRWESPADQEIVFKLLLNDSVWSQGENLKVAPGQTLEIIPTF